jgi:hypothetical protein
MISLYHGRQEFFYQDKMRNYIDVKRTAYSFLALFEKAERFRDSGVVDENCRVSMISANLSRDLFDICVTCEIYGIIVGIFRYVSCAVSKQVPALPEMDRLTHTLRCFGGHDIEVDNRCSLFSKPFYKRSSYASGSACHNHHFAGPVIGVMGVIVELGSAEGIICPF